MFETQASQVSLLAAFAAGLVSFASPCVLPLVPSYVTFITGVSFDELTTEDKTGRIRRLTILHSLAFILGFSLVFIALGATATAAGKFLREYQDVLRQVGGVLIILFGLYLAGLLPIAATPCIGPILASILLYASTAENSGTGILLLSVYSLGLGVPFFLASLGMNTFLAASKKLRSSLRTIEVVSGVILIAFGLALVFNVFRHFVSFLSRYLPAVG
jgi:cytochrome c-type biogenesis protein